MKTFFHLVVVTYLFLGSQSAFCQIGASSPEGTVGAVTSPTPLPTLSPTPVVTATPVPDNRLCINDPAAEIQCGPGTNVGVNFRVMCTSIEELFRAMGVVAPQWVAYWRSIENWVPWISLGGEVRLVTNWRSASDPSQFTYGATGEFWSDINPLYDPRTGNLVRSGEFNRDVSHCITRTGLLCGCGRNNQEGCFPPGVAVTMADGSTKLVEDIVAGDLLWNPVTRSAKRVLQVVEGPEERQLIKIRTADQVLSVSQEHPIRVIQEDKEAMVRVAQLSKPNTRSDLAWKTIQARELQAGSYVQIASGAPAKVLSVEQIPPDEGLYVINFILEGSKDDVAGRMLIADGIVTGDLVVQQQLAASMAKSVRK